MADLSDVEVALAGLVQSALYPSGVPSGGPPWPISPVALAPVTIYPGWPDPATLDDDLAKLSADARVVATGRPNPATGRVHVSIFTRPEERNTTRYPLDWQTLEVAQTTLTAVVNVNVLTFGGTADLLQNAAVILNGVKPYIYATQPADTPATVAAALAAMIVPDFPGTVAVAAQITFPGSIFKIVARVGGVGTSVKEVRRQQRMFQITVWANTPDLRTAVAVPVDLLLAQTERFSLVDGFSARLIYRNSPVLDSPQKVNLYRRDLMYTVEYATTVAQQDAQILVEDVKVNVEIDGATSGTQIRDILI